MSRSWDGSAQPGVEREARIDQEVPVTSGQMEPQQQAKEQTAAEVEAGVPLGKSEPETQEGAHRSRPRGCTAERGHRSDPGLI